MEDYIKPTMKLAIKQIILYYRYTTKIRYSNTLPRLQFGGGLLFYLNENIPCRELTFGQTDSSFKIIFLEINLQPQKRLINGLWKLPNQKENYFLKYLSVAA